MQNNHYSQSSKQYTEKLKSIFINPDQYNFFLSPTIIRSLNKVLEDTDSKKWEEGQKGFYTLILEQKKLTEAYIKRGKTIFDNLFSEMGSLSGNVLDIGGGWGLYRQWWKNKNDDLFIVHDPGIERILLGPSQYHFAIYSTAFSKPAAFVDDFGENIDYKHETFDYVVLAETLDHIAIPEIVLEKSFNVLKKQGVLLIINHVKYDPKKSSKLIYYKNRINQLKNPLVVFKMIYAKIFTKDHHLRTFTQDSLMSIPIRLGFVLKQTIFIKETNQCILKFSKE